MHDSDTMPRCRMSDRCRDFRVDPDLGRVGSPVVAAGGLCFNCSTAARLAVSTMPRRVAELAEQTVEPMRKPGTQRDPQMPRATWRERESPLDLRADALMREIAHELGVWATSLDVFGREPWPAHAAAARWSSARFGENIDARVAAAARHLGERWDDLLGLPALRYRAHGDRPRSELTTAEVQHDQTGMWTVRDGGSAACVFLDLAKASDSFLGYTIRPTRHPDPCPYCGSVGTLVQWPPATPGEPAPINCEGCGRELDEDTFDFARAVFDAPTRHTPEQLEAALYTGTSRPEAA